MDPQNICASGVCQNDKQGSAPALAHIPPSRLPSPARSITSHSPPGPASIGEWGVECGIQLDDPFFDLSMFMDTVLSLIHI